MVTASEQPSLPGRSSMFPQSGCLSNRTSASVLDTGRKHLHARRIVSHCLLILNAGLYKSVCKEVDSRWDLPH